MKIKFSQFDDDYDYDTPMGYEDDLSSWEQDRVDEDIRIENIEENEKPPAQVHKSGDIIVVNGKNYKLGNELEYEYEDSNTYISWWSSPDLPENFMLECTVTWQDGESESIWEIQKQKVISNSKLNYRKKIISKLNKKTRFDAVKYFLEEFPDAPKKRMVCPVCDGTGKSLPESLSGDVTEMLKEDPDFAENYWEGNYDVVCRECGGKNVIEQIDYEELNLEQRKRLEELEEAEREDKSWKRAIEQGKPY